MKDRARLAARVLTELLLWLALIMLIVVMIWRIFFTG
jgi:hypothetical protein